MTLKLFDLAGYDAAAAEKITDEALQYDKLLAPHVKSAEENADYSKMYNPESGEEFIQHSQHLDLKNLLIGLIGEVPEKIIVTEPAFFENLMS